MGIGGRRHRVVSASDADGELPDGDAHGAGHGVVAQLVPEDQQVADDEDGGDRGDDDETL